MVSKLLASHGAYCLVAKSLAEIVSSYYVKYKARVSKESNSFSTPSS